jgi:hypothetical protein
MSKGGELWARDAAGLNSPEMVMRPDHRLDIPCWTLDIRRGVHETRTLMLTGLLERTRRSAFGRPPLPQYPQPRGLRDGIAPAMDAEFAVEAIGVAFDGTNGDIEARGDFLVGKLTGKEQQNFLFALG